ncbi:MAG: signal peptidase I [Patescibacteria group bacterium]
MNFQKVLSFLWETAKLVLISLIIILPIRYFVVQPFFVLGASMEPTFTDGDYLIINELTYLTTGEPTRGDVVVFKYPYDQSKYYIKRIVGLPGEIVVIADDGVTIKNKEHPEGFALNEEYLPPNRETYGNATVALGNDEYYVLGDNRGASSDSRMWGPLKREFITGKVLLRAFPFEKAELFMD